MKKKWYKSKTVLAGLLMITLGAIHYYKSDDIIKAVELISLGLGFIGVRTMEKPLK